MCIGALVCARAHKCLKFYLRFFKMLEKCEFHEHSIQYNVCVELQNFTIWLLRIFWLWSWMFVCLLCVVQPICTVLTTTFWLKITGCATSPLVYIKFLHFLLHTVFSYCILFFLLQFSYTMRELKLHYKVNKQINKHLCILNLYTIHTYIYSMT